MVALCGLFLIGFIIFLPVKAAALKVAPFIVEFEPRGPKSQQSFRVENDTNQRVAIQVTAINREMDEAGKESPTPADDLFAIFPDQLVLNPGEVRSVRVQWLGEASPKVEIPFRIVFEQLPVDFERNQQRGGAFNILISYSTAIYIKPPGAKPDIQVESAASITAQNAHRLRLVLINRGNAHRNLIDFNIRLKLANGEEIAIEGERIKELAGENILPGKKRIFEFSLPAEIKGRVLGAAIQFRSP